MKLPQMSCTVADKLAHSAGSTFNCPLFMGFAHHVIAQSQMNDCGSPHVSQYRSVAHL